jgi:hypothetical protein
MSAFAKRIFNIATVAAVMCAAATSASAQQGIFHLPFDAKWGGVECPAGDYRVSLPERSTGKSTFLVRGPAGPSLILPMTADTYGAQAENQTRAYLQLVKVDGEYFVKKYATGSGNFIFYFKTPRPSHRVQMVSHDFATIPVTGN